MTETALTSSVFETRRDQVFPILEPGEIDRVRRFGTARSFRAGEALATAGEVGAGLMIILTGAVDVTRRNLAGGTQLIVTESAGTFLGELAQLAGRPALTDAHARGDVEALIIPADRLRAIACRGSGAGRAHHARLDLAPRGSAGDRRRRPGDRRTRRRRQCAAGSRASCAATGIRSRISTPRPMRRQRRWLSASTSIPAKCRSFSARADRCCAIPARRNSRAASGWSDRSIRPAFTTWPWSARARPASPPRSMPRRRASRCWCSTAAPSAARPAPRPASRIISASPPASPAWR